MSARNGEGGINTRLNPSFFTLADRYPSSGEEEDEGASDDEVDDSELALNLPRTGTDFLLGPNPVHLNSLSAIPEPIYNVDPTIASRMILQDSARLTGKKPYHKVVYDCFGIGHGDEHFDEESLFRFLETNPVPLNLGTNCQRQNLPKVTSMVNSDTLLFESRFESGNLRRAVQIYDYEYDLILKFDVETNGHTQWFYFSIQNVKRGRKYKFNIVNYLKQDSLYNHGMLPLFYSTNDALVKGQGWIRTGTDVCYYRNNIKRKGGSYYTLTFSFEVLHDNDVCYFAYSYPYTFTNLQNYLNNLEKDKVRSQYLRRRILCTDLAGNACDALTITSFACDPSALKMRKGVVLTARVHPGESNSSWIIKGVIDFLTGSSVESRILRENFIFKIVPMLNPDGVINGNYRCALSGTDLNRKWHNPNTKTHPTIFHTKKMVLQFQKEREVVLFCDFHGHSRKKNMFMYGCTDSKYGVERLLPKVFPRLLWKISPHFSFKDCHFGKQKGKETTARVVMHKSGVKNAFTLEASFCGPDTGIHMGRQFTCKHFEQMGHYFCQGILEYCNPEQTQFNLIVKELDLLFPEKSKDEDSTRDKYSSSEEEDDEMGPPPRVLEKLSQIPTPRILSSRRGSNASECSQSAYSISSVGRSSASVHGYTKPTITVPVIIPPKILHHSNSRSAPTDSVPVASNQRTARSAKSVLQPTPPPLPPKDDKRPDLFQRSQSFSNTNKIPKTTNCERNVENQKKVKTGVLPVSTKKKRTVRPPNPRSLYKPSPYTPPPIDINPFSYDTDKIMQSFKTTDNTNFDPILELIEKVESIKKLRKERAIENLKQAKLKPMHPKPFKKNGKTVSKLLGFATQQVRNKTINLNYRGKSSLRDALSGSTIEVGTPVNDSMSVSVWSKGFTRCLQINRPRESNRITSEVARDFLHQFKVMDTNPIISLITLSGIGNGFLSAGYDMRELQHLMDKGDYETIYSLVRDTHKLAYYAANCETPTMSVINGLMLGPGASLGTSANYVIATPGSLFSAADASYGYYPDCGVTMLLSRVNQKYEGLGTFLGLTGAQIKSSDLVNCGIATSFGVESISQYIAERLLEVQTGATQDDIHNSIIESTESDVPALSFAFELYKIKEHFSNKKSVEEIIQSLKNTITDSAKTKPERDWAANILDNLNQMSPLSLKITFRAIQECDQGLSLDETYQRDYRIASRLIKSKDFKQGVNSILTGIEPVWEHESVEQVPDSVVDSIFAPLSFEKDIDCELQVPEEVFLEDQILYQIKKKQSVQVVKQ